MGIQAVASIGGGGTEHWSERRPAGGGRINPEMPQHVFGKQTTRSNIAKEKRRAAEFKALVKKACEPEKSGKGREGERKDSEAAGG